MIKIWIIYVIYVIEFIQFIERVLIHELFGENQVYYTLRDIRILGFFLDKCEDKAGFMIVFGGIGWIFYSI